MGEGGWLEAEEGVDRQTGLGTKGKKTPSEDQETRR